MKNEIWMAMIAVTAVACGSSGSTAGTTGTTGTGSGSSSTTSTSSGGTTSGSSALSGVVSFSVTPIGGSTTFAVAAAFNAQSTSGTVSTCPSPGIQSGSCCYRAGGSSSSSSGVTAVSAGTLTISDGTAMLATMAYDGGYPVESSVTSSLTWNAGDSLKVSAAGAAAGVSAFTGTVTAAGPVAGVTPALSLISPTQIPIASDFTATWTPGTGGGSMLVSIAALSGESIVCTETDSSGTATIPAALLGHFASGTMCLITLTRSEVGTFSAAPTNASVFLLSSTLANGQCSLQ